MVKSPLKIVLLNHCLDHCLVTVTGGPVIAPAPMVTAAGVTVNPVGGMPSETVPVIPSGTGESSSGVQLTEEPLARTAGVQLHVSVLGESGITRFPVIVCPVPVMLAPTETVLVPCAMRTEQSRIKNSRRIIGLLPFLRSLPCLSQYRRI